MHVPYRGNLQVVVDLVVASLPRSRPHSITSLARASSEGGTSRPSARDAEKRPASRMGADIFAQIEPNLRAPGAAEALRCLSGGYEGGVSIFRRHRDGRLDFRQTASRGSGQYRRGGGLLIRELTNDQPIMVAEGQVPPDEPASHTLEEFGNGFLTIFRLSQHALDGVRSETPARDVDLASLQALLAQSCWASNITATAVVGSRDHDREGTLVAGRNIGHFSRNSGATFRYAVQLSSEQCRTSVKTGKDQNERPKNGHCGSASKCHKTQLMHTAANGATTTSIGVRNAPKASTDEPSQEADAG